MGLWNLGIDVHKLVKWCIGLLKKKMQKVLLVAISHCWCEGIDVLYELFISLEVQNFLILGIKRNLKLAVTMD